MIVRAFALNGLPLVVIGDGPCLGALKRLATKNIEILGWQPSEKVVEYMGSARAFVFAADEDFGIAPVEAQACGTPVIAFGKGGALETVIPLGYRKKGKQEDCPTGVFFTEQTPESINGAVREFMLNEDKFSPSDLRRNALRFSRERFEREIKEFVEDRWREFTGRDFI